MKKEVKCSSIIVLSSPEIFSDESEKELPNENKEELKKYLQNDEDDEIIKKKFSQKVKKNLSRKEKLLLAIVMIKINHLKQLKKQRNLPPKMIHPRKLS